MRILSRHSDYSSIQSCKCATCIQVAPTRSDTSRMAHSEGRSNPDIIQAGAHNCNIGAVPRPGSAMNPAYEYALPTQVARLMAVRETDTDEEGSPHKRKRGSCEDYYDSKERVLAGSPGQGRAPGHQGSCPTALDHMLAPQDTRTDFQVSTQLCSRLTEAYFLPPPPALPPGDFDGVRPGCACDTMRMRNTTEIGPQDGEGMQWWRQSRLQRQVIQGLTEGMSEQGSAAAGATDEHAMMRLQRQLDGFRENDVFLERFQMFGRQHRRRGGACPK